MKIESRDIDYLQFDRQIDELESKLGRNVDCNYNDKGELDELLTIAKRHKDIEIVYLIKEILKIGWTGELKK